MPGPDFIPSFPHYLAAKKTVDDRALNGLVWQTLFDQLVGAQAESPLRVLEIGAGIGTMFERLVERGMLHHAHYTALDALPENITAARSRLRPFAKQSGLRFAELPGGKLQFTGPESELTLQLVARDLFDFIEQQRGFYSWDLLIAH
ncbi:MAG TPA: class I SAM-dependent methyltransferase, partial [Anaerolineales bacterium]|nr:class I SAM-dependent methyltransferase [Anaerolineales bacterium]